MADKSTSRKRSKHQGEDHSSKRTKSDNKNYAKLFYAEEEHAKNVTFDQLNSLKESLVNLIHSNFAKTKLLKDSVANRELSALESIDLNNLRKETSFALLQLRRLNRMIHFKIKKARDTTQEAKQKMDKRHLLLQNLLYEIQQLQKQITTCLQTSSQVDQIDLVPQEEFFASASEELLKDGESLVSDPHHLMKSRLYLELQQRKELCKKLKSSEGEKDTLEKDIEKKQSMLDSLNPKLDNIIESTLDVQKFLKINITERETQYDLARYLPPQLFAIFQQFDAVLIKRTDISVKVKGLLEEAKSWITQKLDGNEVESGGDSDAEVEDQEVGGGGRGEGGPGGNGQRGGSSGSRDGTAGEVIPMKKRRKSRTEKSSAKVAEDNEKSKSAEAASAAAAADLVPPGAGDASVSTTTGGGGKDAKAPPSSATAATNGKLDATSSAMKVDDKLPLASPPPSTTPARLADSAKVKEMRAKLLRPHPLSVVLSISKKVTKCDYSINIIFSLLPKADVVSVSIDSSSEATISPYLTSDLVQHSSLLSCLYPADAGEVLPHQRLHVILQHYGLKDGTKEFEKEGFFLYSWPQKLAGLPTLTSAMRVSGGGGADYNSQVGDNEERPSETVTPTAVDAQRIIQLIKRRVKSRLRLVETIAKCEQNILPPTSAGALVQTFQSLPPNLSISLDGWKKISFEEFEVAATALPTSAGAASSSATVQPSTASSGSVSAGTSFSSTTYKELILQLNSASTLSFFFKVTVKAQSESINGTNGSINCVIAVHADYPNISPVFFLSASTFGGGHKLTGSDMNIRELECGVNLLGRDLSTDDEKEEAAEVQSMAPDILAQQLNFIAASLPSLLRGISSTVKRGGSSSLRQQQQQQHQQQRRAGPARVIPFVADKESVV